MSNNRNHYENILLHLYSISEEEIKKMSDEELEKTVYQKQKESIQISKNPNKFWYIKELPLPKEVEPTTSKKYGVLVVLSLFLVLTGFLILFIVLAFIKN